MHPLQGGDDFEALGFWVVPELEEEVGGLERLANWTSIGPLSRGMPNPPRKVLDYSMTQDDRETPIFFVELVWDHADDGQGKPGRIFDCIKKGRHCSSIIESLLSTGVVRYWEAH